MDEYKLSASLEEHDDDVKCKPFNVPPSFLLTNFIIGARGHFSTFEYGPIRLQRLHGSHVETEIFEPSQV